MLAGPAAMANPPMVATDHSQIGTIPHPSPNVAACAAGFTATPSAIVGSNPYSQSYTCTGPAVVCSVHFSAQNVQVGSNPPQNGGFATPIYGGPITIKGGRMVYTCAEPQPPPR
jgi:hypothetical protein